MLTDDNLQAVNAQERPWLGESEFGGNPGGVPLFYYFQLSAARYPQLSIKASAALPLAVLCISWELSLRESCRHHGQESHWQIREPRRC